MEEEKNKHIQVSRVSEDTIELHFEHGASVTIELSKTC